MRSRQAGVSTVLLERAFVGRGSTAGSSALLLQEPDLELTELVRRYGLRAARRIWQVSQESVQELVALLTRRRIACDLQMRDAIYYATDAEAVGRLRQEWALRARTGFDAAWLRPDVLRRAHRRLCSRRHSDAGQCAVRSLSRVSGYSARRERGGRTGVRTLTSPAHRGQRRSRPCPHAPRCGHSGARGDRDGLRDARVSPAGRSISHVSHLRPGHASRSAPRSAVDLAFRTSCCGTRSVPITMRVGPQTIACCSAAAIDWFGLARGAARCSQQRHGSCARTSRRSFQP